MIKANREIVHRLRNQGKSFVDIAQAFGVSKQYVWSLYTGYGVFYRKSDKYKMYKRHIKGHTRPAKPCTYCLSISTESTTSTKLYY